MAGERDLTSLLRSLAPAIDDQEYTFATAGELDVAKVKRPVGVFREEEGLTVICRCDEAEFLGLKHEGRFRRIVLTVHSSLEAVGLTACVSGALADAGISCNVVAGFYHDYLFVPEHRASEALAILRSLR